MQSSKYARQVPAILAEMEQERERDDNQPDQTEHVPEKVVYIYPLEGGGVVFTETPIEEEESTPRIVESGEQETDQHPTSRKDPPYFLHFILLLLLFVGLDSADTSLTALLAPTVTITLIPNVQTVTIHSSLTLGKLVTPLTLTESQTLPTTGHGHQDATYASGTVTFFNGQQNSQTVVVGTVLTGSDGVAIATTQSATIPPGNPSTGYGTVTVPAQAIQKGSRGNIQAGDVNTTLALAVFVKNNQFQNGQDARDFHIVMQADRDGTTNTVKAKVTASMIAALQGQGSQGEQVQEMPCIPTVTANHAVGDEATTITVTVSETCTAIVYNSLELKRRATQLLTTQVAKTVEKDYTLEGTVQVTLTKATVQTDAVFLSVTAMGTWVYQINQATVTRLVMGKPRLDALRVLSANPGIKEATIAGVRDNQVLPTEGDHIHIVVLLFVQ